MGLFGILGHRGDYFLHFKRESVDQYFKFKCHINFKAEASTLESQDSKTMETTTPRAPIDPAVEAIKPSSILRNLSFLDRFLPLWIIMAMIIGVVAGNYSDLAGDLDSVKFDTVSLPIAIGMIVMMIPPLCKVQWEKFPQLVKTQKVWRNVALSIFMNWVIGPFVMLGLAEATLFDLPGYKTGVIMVGLARCIAMVMIWNQIACGDVDLCAILVIINSVLQIVLYAPYALFFVNVFSDGDVLELSYSSVARAVGIYLGIPLGVGMLLRFSFLLSIGREYYDKKVLPIISPWALIGLLYTIIILFGYQAKHILHNLGPVFRVFVPMVLYFAIMWALAFITVRYFEAKYNRRIFGARKGPDYKVVIPQTFTTASNNFELSIAVATGVYGVQSEQALAATIGPLVEVPVLVALSYVALWLRTRLQWADVDEQGRDLPNVEETVPTTPKERPALDAPVTVTPIDSV